jgi:two-component system invasion response regulator UvrY
MATDSDQVGGAVSSAGPRQGPVRVLTVDDQAVFRRLARLVVSVTEGFESLAELASGEQALDSLDALEPDLVLVDVRMPGMTGIETASRIRAARPDTVVVLISIEDALDLPDAAHDCGAAAVVRKQDFGSAMLRELWSEHGRQ